MLVDFRLVIEDLQTVLSGMRFSTDVDVEIKDKMVNLTLVRVERQELTLLERKQKERRKKLV